jgi:hypothetical protein
VTDIDKKQLELSCSPEDIQRHMIAALEWRMNDQVVQITRDGDTLEQALTVLYEVRL